MIREADDCWLFRDESHEIHTIDTMFNISRKAIS